VLDIVIVHHVKYLLYIYMYSLLRRQRAIILTFLLQCHPLIRGRHVRNVAVTLSVCTEISHQCIQYLNVIIFTLKIETLYTTAALEFYERPS